MKNQASRDPHSSVSVPLVDPSQSVLQAPHGRVPPGFESSKHMLNFSSRNRKVIIEGSFWLLSGIGILEQHNNMPSKAIGFCLLVDTHGCGGRKNGFCRT